MLIGCVCVVVQVVNLLMLIVFIVLECVFVEWVLFCLCDLNNGKTCDWLISTLCDLQFLQSVLIGTNLRSDVVIYLSTM